MLWTNMFPNVKRCRRFAISNQREVGSSLSWNQISYDVMKSKLINRHAHMVMSLKNSYLCCFWTDFNKWDHFGLVLLVAMHWRYFRDIRVSCFYIRVDRIQKMSKKAIFCKFRDPGDGWKMHRLGWNFAISIFSSILTNFLLGTENRTHFKNSIQAGTSLV